ncbi:unnamed protein product [Leuciscus chuanchicus]
MLCPGKSVGCRGPALTDRDPAVRGGELLMSLSMQPLSQARLEASGRSQTSSTDLWGRSWMFELLINSGGPRSF